MEASNNPTIYVFSMIPTKSELLLRTAFEEIKVPVLTDQVYCFLCDNHFSWVSDKSLPSFCNVCGRYWNKGEVAYPDMVIRWYFMGLTGGLQTRQGIIRVDGGVHQKRRQANHDYWQVKDFRQRGWRVFIILNEELSKKEPEKNKEIAHKISDMMSWSDEKYQAWFDSPEMQERVRKIP